MGRGDEDKQASFDKRKVPTRTGLASRALSREAVKAVERGADVRQTVMLKNDMIKKTTIRGMEPPQLLAYDVAEHSDALMDTGGEKPDLGDRVVNMRAKGVPFGLWGTVVATHSHSSCVEVVFDEEFIGGTTLHGMCSNYRGALVPWATVAKIHTRARMEALRASGASHQSGAAVPAKGRRGGGKPQEVGSREGTSDAEATAAAAARLKGMLGVGASSTSQASAGASVRGSTRTREAGHRLKKTDAVCVPRTVETEKATAELKAMIGVGGGDKRSPDILGGNERGVADGTTSTRHGERVLPQGALSPGGSGRRGQGSQFRQAKGPDKNGTGFKVSRGSGASAMLASDAKSPPLPRGSPSTQPSSTLVRAAGGDGDSLRSWGGLGEMVKGATDLVDDATRSRVIRGQEQALADANARHVSSMPASAKGGEQKTASSTTTARPKESPTLTPAAKKVSYNAEPKRSGTVMPSAGGTSAPISPSHQQHTSDQQVTGFLPSRLGMGMGGASEGLPLSHPMPPSWFGPGTEESAQRVLWQQQRMFEGFQMQQQHGHHVLLQPQHMQQQHYPAGMAGPLYTQMGAYPGAAQLNAPGVAFVQHPQPYQLYGHPQGMGLPHPQSQAFGGYPMAPAPFPAPAQAPTPADASKIPRGKPRKTSMMIPSSALLAGSRRGSKASRDGGHEEQAEDSRDGGHEEQGGGTGP